LDILFGFGLPQEGFLFFFKAPRLPLFRSLGYGLRAYGSRPPSTLSYNPHPFHFTPFPERCPLSLSFTCFLRPFLSWTNRSCFFVTLRIPHPILFFPLPCRIRRNCSEAQTSCWGGLFFFFIFEGSSKSSCLGAPATCAALTTFYILPHNGFCFFCGLFRIFRQDHHRAGPFFCLFGLFGLQTPLMTTPCFPRARTLRRIFPLPRKFSFQFFPMALGGSGSFSRSFLPTLFLIRFAHDREFYAASPTFRFFSRAPVVCVHSSCSIWGILLLGPFSPLGNECVPLYFLFVSFPTRCFPEI